MDKLLLSVTYYNTKGWSFDHPFIKIISCFSKNTNFRKLLQVLLKHRYLLALKEQNIDFEAKPVICSGIEECRMALLKLSKNPKILGGNFIEGMACLGGCINGAGCLTHGEKNKNDVDKYGREAMEKTISDAVSILQ